MDTLSYKTVSGNKETAKKEWLLIDAEGETTGRLASMVAFLLRGKHKPDFTPHADMGDNVVVINAEKVVFTGKKMTDKEYITYSGLPGGQKRKTPEEVLTKKPADVVENAVRGMLPKTRLGRAIFNNMYVYVGKEHGHEAQKPRTIDLNQVK
ncbi:MAG: 50S ribosomal protein L13 [Bacteroidota bacterium]|nr:50S ribosomal protein L13 [Bacteroidota bacterium]